MVRELLGHSLCTWEGDWTFPSTSLEVGLCMLQSRGATQRVCVCKHTAWGAGMGKVAKVVPTAAQPASRSEERVD
jgi:hypothetical protein